MENQGDAYYEDGPRGSLLLKIAVSPAEAAPVSKYVKENVPATDSVSLEPSVHTSRKPSDQLPSTAAVRPPPPLEPETEPTPAQTTPATSEKSGNEKWVMPPLPPVCGTSSLPSSIPEKPRRKPVVTVISLAAVIILVVAGIVGIAHQASVSAANINATATTSTIDANAIATATAKANAADFAKAVATVNGGATADAKSSANEQATVNANPIPIWCWRNAL